MSLNVIDKYVEKKKKDLFEYTKILEEIIKVEDNKLWKNKEEFKGLAKGVIEKYANTYYFENNANRDNPIKYSNDNINNVLKRHPFSAGALNELSRKEILWIRIAKVSLIAACRLRNTLKIGL